MILKSASSNLITFIVRGLILDVLYWPVWWYSVGLKKSFTRAVGTIKQGNAELALSVWVKNIFRPMYGQYNWEGRIISFFMRAAQIVFRCLLLSGWIIFALAGVVIWITVPIFLFAQVILNLGLLKFSS